MGLEESVCYKGEKMECAIIVVGSELLNGDTLERNGQMIQQAVREYGIRVKYQLAVSDHFEELKEALSFLYPRVDYLIVAGGLGPTFDDITRDVIASFLSLPLEENQEALERMNAYFSKRQLRLSENNLAQIRVLKGSYVIQNLVGIAPAFEINRVVAFPGVPRELKMLLDQWLVERVVLKSPIKHHDLLTWGVPESHLEMKIRSLVERYQVDYEFEILAREYGVIIRTIYHSSQEESVQEVIQALKEMLGESLYGENQERLESILCDKLRQHHLTISVAESCSGGRVSALLTSVPGASELFDYGVVSYSNSAKERVLKVSPFLLESVGAVSEACVLEMLQGLTTPVRVAISGIAGPSGGSYEKPVGLVYIGVKIKESVWIAPFHFSGNRERVQQQATLQAIYETIRRL